MKLIKKIESGGGVFQRLPTAAKFGLVGILNTLIDFVAFAALHYLVALPVLVANTLAFSIATCNSYVINRYWTFAYVTRPSASIPRECARFLIGALAGLAIGNVSVAIFSAHFPLLIAKSCAMVATFLVNYTVNKFFVFRPQPEAPTVVPAIVKSICLSVKQDGKQATRCGAEPRTLKDGGGGNS